MGWSGRREEFGGGSKRTPQPEILPDSLTEREIPHK
jgi:hypothetical protein